MENRIVSLYFFTKVFIFVLFFFLFQTPVNSIVLHIPYNIVIEKIDPPIDCLRFQPTSTSIEIINRCPQIFSLEGKIVGNSETLHDNIESISHEIFGIGKPKSAYPISWILQGKLGTKPLIISGQTTYSEEEETDQEYWPLPLRTTGILMIPLLIFFTVIVILEKKKKLRLTTFLLSLIGSFIIPLVAFHTLLWIISKNASSPEQYSSQMRIAVNAAGKHNERACEPIDDNDLHKACIAMTNNMPSSCKQLSEADTIDWCYLQIATTMKNPDACEYIIYPQNRDSCYFQIAIETASPSICQNIHDTYSNRNPDNRALCLRTIRRGW